MPRLAYLAIAFLPGVLSQTISKAICSVSSLNWASNSLGDSPCQVAAQLAGVCNGGVFTLQPLDPGFVYLGPSLTVQNSCRCSSVYYSMLSACAACQGRNWLDWSEYNGNCTTVYPTVFPQPLPLGTRVPGWAYADVTVTNGFNLSTAQALDTRPESTGISTPTSSSFPTSRTIGTTGTLSFTTPRSSSTAGIAGADGSSGSGSGTNAGAIAGGVIGGVVGLALVAGLLFFFLRRRREASEKPASSAFNTTPYMAAAYGPEQNMSYNPTTSPYPSDQAQKLYDPADPSTFPTTPTPVASSPYTNPYSPPPASTTYSTFQNSTTQVQHGAPHMPTPAPTGHYTGAPEL
ncbi:hypothetical protein P691DRAFT_806802 [Macrolepiota fuliginosa MF-IS2]|uniref:Transmembrane protein n=1 Tax=Macrolepiota fuliginosa MF-IS2 TaxID=1400762 RepID=A0A9P5XQ18_9AGAR|nr:hypothetical protein P691DRAFT_806802 [Macrolepiota fuliginosa MF-IS2]